MELSSHGPERKRDRQVKQRNVTARYVLAGLGVIAAIILVWLMFAATVTVGTGQIAVMTRLGDVTGQELGSGFHLKNPFDKANVYDIKTQKEQVDAAAASKDLQDVKATLVVNYNLEAGKISTIHRTLGTKYKEKVVDPAIQEIFKSATAKFNATELITERGRVKHDAQTQLTERLEKFGVRVQDLSITNFSFSPEFTAAIEAKQVAQQNAERAKFNLEASRTEAEAQAAQGATLTPQFLQKLFLDKWNGVLPQVMGSDTSLLLQLAGQPS